MKKKIFLKLIVVVCLFIITGCGKSTKLDLETKSYKSTEVKNVSVNISDISLTGATITIKDTNEEPYIYGEWYKIEKEDNGKWKELEVKDKNYGFNDLGYKVNKDNEVKFVLDWKELYGELPLGSYRIVKEVNNQYIYVDFGIATTSTSSDTDERGLYLIDESRSIYSDMKDPKMMSDGKVVSVSEIKKTFCMASCIHNNSNPIAELNDGGSKIYEYKVKNEKYYVIECNRINSKYNNGKDVIISKDKEKLADLC